MVAGPASRPAPANSTRRFTIRSTTSAGTRFGELLGRRDFGSNAASPSSRQRASHLDTVASDNS
jgi:hypothetical protein